MANKSFDKAKWMREYMRGYRKGLRRRIKRNEVKMSEVLDIERIAALIDPEVWVDTMPVPTRGDTIDWHFRRQASVGIAEAVIAEIESRRPIPKPKPPIHKGVSIRRRETMKVFVWNRIDKATESYHCEGGLVVFANDIERARELANARDGCELRLDETPDHERDVTDGDEAVIIMPDAGCC